MFKEFAEYLVGLKRSEIISDKDGNEYILCDQRSTYKKIKSHTPLINENLESSTLQGIVDYIKMQTDIRLIGEKLLIDIKSPLEVSLFSDVFYEEVEHEHKRIKLVTSKAILPTRCINRFMDTEQFVIELMSKYEETPDLNDILVLASNIVKNSDVQVADDGISQKVQAKTGIATVKNVEVKNPFKLKPYRTFTEVEQPESYFIFRIDKNGDCSLFDSGDSSWRNEAMNKIKAFLEEKLQGENVNIIM